MNIFKKITAVSCVAALVVGMTGTIVSAEQTAEDFVTNAIKANLQKLELELDASPEMPEIKAFKYVGDFDVSEQLMTSIVGIKPASETTKFKIGVMGYSNAEGDIATKSQVNINGEAVLKATTISDVSEGSTYYAIPGYLKKVVKVDNEMEEYVAMVEDYEKTLNESLHTALNADGISSTVKETSEGYVMTTSDTTGGTVVVRADKEYNITDIDMEAGTTSMFVDIADNGWEVNMTSDDTKLLMRCNEEAFTLRVNDVMGVDVTYGVPAEGKLNEWEMTFVGLEAMLPVKTISGKYAYKGNLVMDEGVITGTDGSTLATWKQKIQTSDKTIEFSVPTNYTSVESLDEAGINTEAIKAKFMGAIIE